MDDTSSIDAIAEQDVGFSFLKSYCFSWFLIDINYWRITRPPYNIHLTRWCRDVIRWVVHNLKFNSSPNMNIDWWEWLDNALNSYSEYIEHIRMLRQVNLDIALSSAFCFHIKSLVVLIKLDRDNPRVGEFDSYLYSFDVICKLMAMLILEFNWDVHWRAKREIQCLIHILSCKVKDICD